MLRRAGRGASLEPGTGEGRYEGRADLLDKTPYSVFSPRPPSRLRVTGAEIEWVLLPGEADVTPQAVERWIEREARVVASYLGRFPVPRVAVIVRPRRGGGDRSAFGGTTMGYAGASIRASVAPDIEDETSDWLLVHELVHLGLPNLPSEQRWMEEGLPPT